MKFNAGLSKAVAVLAPFKRKFPLISWADLIQMAGSAAVFTTGGPLIDLQYGREDVPTDLRELTQDQEDYFRSVYGNPLTMTTSEVQRSVDFPRVFPPYPHGEATADVHLRRIFFRMGLNSLETVALMGAHTIGRAFQDRSGVCPFSSGDQGATQFTKMTSAAHGSLHPTDHGVGMAGGRSYYYICIKVACLS